jgi:hypothetical protein
MLEFCGMSLPCEHPLLRIHQEDWQNFDLIRSLPDWVGEIGSIVCPWGASGENGTAIFAIWLGAKPQQLKMYEMRSTQMVFDSMPGTWRAEYFEYRSRALLGVEIAKGPCLVLSPPPGISMAVVIRDAIHDKSIKL